MINRMFRRRLVIGYLNPGIPDNAFLWVEGGLAAWVEGETILWAEL